MAALRASERPGGLRPVIGGYFDARGARARLVAGQRLMVAVEYAYGSRLIRAGDEGARYHLFGSAPARD